MKTIVEMCQEIVSLVCVSWGALQTTGVNVNDCLMSSTQDSGTSINRSDISITIKASNISREI